MVRRSAVLLGVLVAISLLPPASVALAGTCSEPCVGLYSADSQFATQPPNVDATPGATSLNGTLNWAFVMQPYPATAVTNAKVTVNSGYAPSSFSPNCSGSALTAFPFSSSQPSLSGSQQLGAGLCSSIPSTFTPGFDSVRSFSPLVIPAGGAQQTVAISMTLTDTKTCRKDLGAPAGCLFKGAVSTGGLAGASIVSRTGPSNLAPNEIFGTGKDPGGWSLLQPALGKTYTVTVVISLPDRGASYSFKPQVDLSSGSGGASGCQVDKCSGPATSDSFVDPTLDGPAPGSGQITFAADQSVLWDEGGGPSAGTEVRYSGLQQAPGGPYNPVVPARVLDTRSGLGGSSTVGGGQAITVAIAGKGGVPVGATGVVLNVTVTNPSADGFLTIWPAGGARPNASSLNFVAGQTIPNLVQVALGTGGAVSIFNSAGSSDVIADVQGYTGTAAKPGAGLFTPVTPSRLLDTRAGGTLGPGGQTDLQVTGAGGVPSTGVSGVVLNVTVTNPSAGGYLTIWPSGAARPLASNLNFTPGLTIPNRVEVQVGGGKVSIYNSAGSSDVIVDVNGWYSDGSGTPPAVGNFTGVTPTRLLDTRSSGSLGPGGVQNLTVTGGAAGLPSSGVTAVVLNVTVTNPSASGYLTVWPAGAARPTASDLNFSPGQTIPNLVVVGVSSAGAIAIYNFAGTSDVIVDIAGWYS